MPNSRLLFFTFISCRGFLFSISAPLFCTPTCETLEMFSQGHSKFNKIRPVPRVGSPSPEFCCVASWTQRPLLPEGSPALIPCPQQSPV